MTDGHRKAVLFVEAQHFLESFQLQVGMRKVNGIGPKAGAKLAALGVETIGQLAQWQCDALVQQFGRSYGAWLFDAAHGIDERPLVTHSEPVSMSRETTFERDLHAKRDKAETLAEIRARGVSAEALRAELGFD